MEIVPFLLAKKLKEKGFREKVNAYYGKHENIFDVHPALDMNDADYRASASTISQVLKWLREECGIFIIVEPDILSPGYKLTFTPRVKFYIKGEEDEGFSEYLTYRRDSHELAALAGIEYVIDNLI